MISFRVQKNISEGQMCWLWSRPTFRVSGTSKKTHWHQQHTHPP